MGDSEITADPTQQQDQTPPQQESTLGRGYIGLGGVIAILAYLILFVAADFYVVVSIWPPPPIKQSATQKNEQPPTSGTTSTPGAPTNQADESASAPASPSQSTSPSPTNESQVKGAASTTKGAASGARGPQKKAAAPPNTGSTPPPSGAQKKAPTTTNIGSSADGNEKNTSTSEQDREPWPVKLFWMRECKITLNSALFLIVMLCGSMGSLLHALRSFYWYTGNRALKWSWAGMYVTLPFAGALIAMVFYLIIRGGLASTAPNVTSAYGYAALGTLVGLFSEQAILQLKQIAEKILAKPEPGDPKEGKDNVLARATASPAAATPPPKISDLSQKTGAAGTSLTITGDNFTQGAKVNFGGTAATVGGITTSSIAITTPAHAAGAVDVEVINPDGKNDVLRGAFTYQ